MKESYKYDARLDANAEENNLATFKAPYGSFVITSEHR